MNIKSILVFLAVCLSMGGCDVFDSGSNSNNAPLDNEPQTPAIQYSAQIERTEYGTAHITADDWGSLGFGQGYAAAQDRFCVIADQMLKLRSQRSRYFGPGDNDANLETDFAYLALGVIEKAATMLASWPEEEIQMVEGYAAGVNQYLADTGVDNLPGECASQDWVQEVDTDGLVALGLDFAMLPGSRNFLDAIANGTPPGNENSGSIALFTGSMPMSLGSNGIALGDQATTNGKGLLLANPHWPWEGERRFHEVHLTVPGDIDIAGISLAGVVGVLLGFNDSMAWTHTTSFANAFILYSLNLVPGNPTRYFFGEEERDMVAQDFTIEVLQEDGSVLDQSRTLYQSHYGPMLDPSALGLAWTDATAYSIYDLNADNLQTIFGATARAKSVAELREVFRNVGGRPGQHALATDNSGAVFYADTGPIPNLSEQGEAEFRALVDAEEFSLTQFAFDQGLVLLDGSDPVFSIDFDESATKPGAIPFSEAPQLSGRRDFVANSNDNHWLTNPAQPLTGYSPRWGEEETPRRMRLRMGLTQLAESPVWDRSSLKDLLFENRSYTELLWRDLFVSHCSQFTEALASGGETVDISAACTILSNWDGNYNLDSIGAIVFRELMTWVDNFGLFRGTSYFAVPFDAADPVATPGGLSPEGEDYLLTQLADSVLRLQQAGVPVDAPLGDYQYSLEGDERFAIHGGKGNNDSVLNLVSYSTDRSGRNNTLLDRMERGRVYNLRTGLTEDGYLINFGSSFIMVVEFTDDGPVADALLVYSQSDDPASPHFGDQMSLFSSKTWRPLPFSREQIESDPTLTSIQVSN